MTHAGMRLDPTRMGVERRRLESMVRKRWAWLRAVIRKAVAVDDMLRLSDPVLNSRRRTGASQPDSPGKVKRFREWLRSVLGSTAAGDDLLAEGIAAGYRKGAARAWNDLHGRQAMARQFVAAPLTPAVPKDRPTLGDRRVDPVKGAATGHGAVAAAASMGASQTLSSPPYFPQETEGEQWVRLAFLRGATVQKAKLLAGRMLHELEDVDVRMSTKMTRLLADGLMRHRSPAAIAKDMAHAADLELPRALLIARTELVRAHAEGQLDALQELGQTKIGVMAEWTVAEDAKVCGHCKPMEGKQFSIKEARGMIPRHPNCRCAWVPLVVRPRRRA